MRWIFFDAVGTLFAVRGSVGGQYARAARLFGDVPQPEKIDEAFRHLLPLAPPLAFSAPAGHVRDFEFNWWKDLVRKIADRAGMLVEFDPYFEHIFKMFATAVCWDLYPETPATLKLLKQQGYGVGIISNFDSRLLPLLDDLGLRRWIARVTNSSAVGYAKPDPRIFLEACAQARAKPESSWHVGDSFMEDCDGACKAGLKTILLDRRDRHPDFTGLKVKRLSQIFPLLEAG